MARVVNWDAKEIALWREMYERKKIGVTFSCFDLLHAGHVLMLRDAKDQCDILVVGLQTDPTIDRPEKNKPITSYKERLTILQSLRYVDYVVKYNTEEELLKVLDKLKPNVRILGDDYKNKNFTGKDLNIPIHYHLRSQHDYSTTNLRQRVYESELAKLEN